MAGRYSAGTYLQLENSNSHVIGGRNGSRNWRVMGIKSPPMSSAETKVLANGPGASETDKEKMAIMARMRYCPSYMDHG